MNDNNDEFKKSMQKNSNETTSRFSKLRANPYFAGFLYIFFMELGDKTQLLTISLASIYRAPIEVWLGSFLALISVAWIGILLGGFISKKVPKFYLKILSTSIFILVGIFVIISSLV
jgi:putative Ca2+/H+ antiporter (TMEM165/GDT1 family)